MGQARLQAGHRGAEPGDESLEQAVTVRLAGQDRRDSCFEPVPRPWYGQTWGKLLWALWSRPVNPYAPNPCVPNPFAVLGLPEWPDLEDETVDAAWRAIAAETHPDRPDGGNLARYTQATAAYFELHSPWGRSEAFADLLEAAWAEGRFDAYPGHYPPGYDPGDPGDDRGKTIFFLETKARANSISAFVSDWLFAMSGQ